VSLIEALYNHDFTITRPARTDDGQGGWTMSDEPVGTVRGRLRPATATERTSADQRQARVTHVLYCAATADVRRGDLVLGAGQAVKVVDIREPSHAGHHLEVDCVETQLEGEQEAGS
jgi:SPP1 family predicted phage head-tail adaptor